MHLLVNPDLIFRQLGHHSNSGNNLNTPVSFRYDQSRSRQSAEIVKIEQATPEDATVWI